MPHGQIGDSPGPSKRALVSIFLGGGVVLVLLLVLIVAGGRAAYDLYKKGQDDESQAKLVSSADEGPPSGVEPSASTAKPEEAAPQEVTAGESDDVEAPVAEASEKPGSEAKPPLSEAQRDTAGSANPNVSIGDLVVVGGLSGDQIKQMMARHERQLGQCFEREMQRNPRLNGRLVFQVTIGPDGRVVQADIEEDELNNSAVANCSRTRLMRLLFPTPKGGGIARVSLPVVFGPNQ